MEEKAKQETDFVKTAMNILIDAGDARAHATESMKECMNGNYEEAEKLLHKAKECIKSAHKSQTDVIQKEAGFLLQGNATYDIPLLFIHAQDTLMTIISEVNMIELMETMYRRMEERCHEKQ